MIQFSAHVDWTGTVLWLAGLALAGFLVSWVVTERLRLARSLYVGVLAAVAAALTAGYLIWAGAGAAFWSGQWAWGILGAVVASAVLALVLRRLHLVAAGLARPGLLTVVWETVVYGAAEGMLLSALPVAVVWAGMAAAGWTSGGLAIGAGAAALAASALVIAVHHLGYSAFRSRRMVQPVVGCLVLSLAYLLTGSVVAPLVGHMLLHGLMLRKGMELPPEHAVPRPAVPVLQVA